VVVISAVSLLVFFLVDLTRTLRVSAEGEMEGIDLYEHGTHAYHMEFGQGSSFSTFSASTTRTSNGAPDPTPTETEKASS
jgi:hypothetical protein